MKKGVETRNFATNPFDLTVNFSWSHGVWMTQCIFCFKRTNGFEFIVCSLTIHFQGYDYERQQHSTTMSTALNVETV